jgi:hypothetical protein
MSPVALEPELVAKLTSNGGHVPLTDATGKPVGYFLSQDQFESMRQAVMEHLSREPILEDFRRALANPRRHTMEEVFKLLEGE